MSFTAVDFLDFNFFSDKDETTECWPTVTLKYRHALP